VEPPYLFVAATSRHVLSYEEAWPVEAAGSGSFSLGAAYARQLVAAIPRKAGWRLETTVAYEPDDELITVTPGDASAPLRFHAVPGAFPDVRREIERRVDGTRATIVFNPDYLALLAKVEVQTRSGKPYTAHFQLPARDDEPVRVSVGETFRAMFMPVRNAG